MSQGVNEETIFFLMEDGTVEYIPLYYALKNNDIRSYGAINEVSDVVNLISVAAQPKDSPVGGHLSVLALKADGTYYDLLGYLAKTSYYDDL